MFTVVIPTYNSSSTIKSTLDSVCRQNRDLISKVIVVDDCSSDSNELCKVIESFRCSLDILFLRNESNKNGSYSRNVGIKNSNSKYIAFLDADDVWLDGHIEKYYKNILNLSFPVNVIFFSPFILTDTSGLERDIRPKRPLSPGELVSEYVFFHGQHMQTSTFVVETSTAKKVLFDETLTRHQDSDFMMRAQKLGVEIKFINIATSKYIFSQNDLAKRVASGRISSLWCDDFLVSKSEYFSSKSSDGYLINVKLRVCFFEKKYFNMAKVFYLVAKSMGFVKVCYYLFEKISNR
ncbi:glycosyltransferase family 2 protein [Vibrio sp. LQ2]|uniref:glycosyltransferase family 2 protein n=1 Tax=Vibrio TaxID=662 RepID=UPI001F2DD797|nr:MULTISPECIES: glycosyltransferase family A protein [Vibrio]MCE7622164.1 glycosyltransferase family 2 protein [Vibrio fluvialis]UPO64774.1 glycosyl transferase [Vibrio fluvialis]USP05272.1 glycosyltransferase family 2 protein [Vibrio sp. LQ2]